MTMYYEVFNPKMRLYFEDHYKAKPHLYKKHEKKFTDEYDCKHLRMVNNFVPDDINEWIDGLKNKGLLNYEMSLYTKIDRIDNSIIISYYEFRTVGTYLKRRAVFDLNENDEKFFSHAFTEKTIGSDLPYVLLPCDGRYVMGGYTDYDRFYTQKQRFLDYKSYEIIKNIPAFKYIPLEQLKSINPYLLFEYMDNKEWLYQIEILIKMGKKSLATDILLDRQAIEMKHFKMFKKEIQRGIRLNALNSKINEINIKADIEKKKIERQELALKLSQMPKILFDLGNYILRSPNDLKDLENEGRELKHCVSTYLKKIVNGDSIVLFLRKKDSPIDPFFTVEINPKSNMLIQCRTLSNKSDEEISTIVNDFIIDKPLGVLLNGSSISNNTH